MKRRDQYTINIKTCHQCNQHQCNQHQCNQLVISAISTLKLGRQLTFDCFISCLASSFSTWGVEIWREVVAAPFSCLVGDFTGVVASPLCKCSIFVWYWTSSSFWCSLAYRDGGYNVYVHSLILHLKKPCSLYTSQSLVPQYFHEKRKGINVLCFITCLILSCCSAILSAQICSGVASLCWALSVWACWRASCSLTSDNRLLHEEKHTLFNNA